MAEFHITCNRFKIVCICGDGGEGLYAHLMEVRRLRFSKSYCLHCSILHSSTDSILLIARLRYSCERSHPSHRLLSCSAVTAVVPEPRKGSNSRSPTLDEANMMR